MDKLTVVIAPDSFKGSLSATEAAASIAEGWRSHRPDDGLLVLPQADGGEGTIDAIEYSIPGSWRQSAGLVTGPDGTPVHGEWLNLPDGTAVVELAQMSGLPLMGALDPIGATTTGLGEVMANAIDSGVERMIVGLGGSASTDGGMGALAALGNRRPPPGGVRILTDVDAPLLGPAGAAAVFAPQKGADAEDVAALEQRLAEVARQLGTDPTRPGTGAAGGAAYGLQHWGGVIESGAAFIAELTGLDIAISHADQAVTGEGRFDSQSTGGKLVGHVITQARRNDVPIVVIAGSVDFGIDLPRTAQTHSLVDLAGTLDAALADPRRWLRVAGNRAARRVLDTADLADTARTDVESRNSSNSEA